MAQAQRELGPVEVFFSNAGVATGGDPLTTPIDVWNAAQALDANHFVVGSDEDNTLRIYARGRPDAVASLALAQFLGSVEKESDLEGSASVGRRIYWLASHGRNSRGKERPERQRFFATDIDTGRTPPALLPVAAPYRHLLDDMLRAAELSSLKLGYAARLAPEAPGGLNIEGLAARPDGSLLIGFRNPVPNGKALLVPLLNPDEVIAGKAARFGEPILLKLRGRGVRSIERVGSHYLIVAGPTADLGTFSLYRWSGAPGDAPQLVGFDFTGVRPEALFEWPLSGALQILSDDGGVESDGVACKELPPPRRSFRAITLRP